MKPTIKYSLMSVAALPLISVLSYNWFWWNLRLGQKVAIIFGAF